VLAISFVLVAACGSATQDNVILFPIPIHVDTEFVRAATARSGTVQGIVVDARDGQLIRGAQVFLVGTSSGAVTDTLGRFSFTTAITHRAELKATYVGFGETHVELDFGAEAGYVGRIALAPAPIDLCADPVDPTAPVTIIVRDVRTGRAPESSVTLVARDGHHVLTDRAAPQNAAAAILRLHQWRSGTYDLTVSGDGYTPWVRNDIQVPARGCTRWQTLSAWLLPAGERVN
jgi:hypothetical protein